MGDKLTEDDFFSFHLVEKNAIKSVNLQSSTLLRFLCIGISIFQFSLEFQLFVNRFSSNYQDVFLFSCFCFKNCFENKQHQTLAGWFVAGVLPGKETAHYISLYMTLQSFPDSPSTPNSPLHKRRHRRADAAPPTPLSASSSVPNSATLSSCEGDVFTFENGDTISKKG